MGKTIKLNEESLKHIINTILTESVQDPDLRQAFNDTKKTQGKGLSGFATRDNGGVPYDKAKVVAKLSNEEYQNLPENIKDWMSSFEIAKYIMFSNGSVLFLATDSQDRAEYDEKVKERNDKFQNLPDEDKLIKDPWEPKKRRPATDRLEKHLNK